jgi:hypothetical protein
VFARERDGEVAEEIEPEAEMSKDARFVAEAIAEELEGFFTVAGAE